MDLVRNIFTPVKRPHRIGFLLVDGFALMSYASVAEPFRAANLLAGRPLYELRNYAVSGNAARSSNRAVVPSDGAISKADDLDMVMVVAGGSSAEILKAPIQGVLRALDQKGVTLGGVSGGPLILAAAGLMEGRRMTVHWEHMPALKELSPTLMIEHSLYVIDRNRVTCAGGIAPMDMIHSLIAQTHGAEFARKVSDWFLHTEVRPSQGAQRSGLIERYGTSNRVVIDAIELMRNHIGAVLSLPQLATLTGVTPRHLNRLFVSHVGISTMAFYLDLRLEYSERLLRNSSLPITEVALAVGFSDSSHFSTAFRAKYGAAPSRYAGFGKNLKSQQVMESPQGLR